ncbi:hypothetical protein CPB86DRAFT_714414, partial [Serendipita vermifera]
DYTTGEPRRHPTLYLEDGTLVMQVCGKAIFKVHRSILSRYSSVLQGMFTAPRDTEINDGTDENPLVLTGDSAVAWELLLGLQYDSPRVRSGRLPGQDLLQILSVAHKYCMERITTDIIEELKTTTAHDGFVDLVVASQIIDSPPLYQDGIQRLISSGQSLTKEQANRMGSEATHAVMIAIVNGLRSEVASITLRMNRRVAAIQEEMDVALKNVDNTKCRFCNNSTEWSCSQGSCRRRQPSQPKPSSTGLFLNNL